MAHGRLPRPQHRSLRGGPNGGDGSWAPSAGPAVSFPSVGYAAIVARALLQPASVFLAEAGGMTVIMPPAGFCMAHARCVRLALYVTGLPVG